jgi:hypothetical protein
MLKLSGCGALRGLAMALMATGLLMAPSSYAQRPNPANTAAIAAGKEMIDSMEKELATVRSTVAAIEGASREAHAWKAYAAWLEGQMALGRQSFDAKKPDAKPVVTAKAAEAKASSEAARAWRNTKRAEFNALISSIAIDQRPLVRPELEAILNAEASQISIADQLSRDFDNVLQSLGDGTPPYALFNARAQMREQAATMLRQANDSIAAASEKLKSLQPPA